MLVFSGVMWDYKNSSIFWCREHEDILFYFSLLLFNCTYQKTKSIVFFVISLLDFILDLIG